MSGGVQGTYFRSYQLIQRNDEFPSSAGNWYSTWSGSPVRSQPRPRSRDRAARSADPAKIAQAAQKGDSPAQLRQLTELVVAHASVCRTCRCRSTCARFGRYAAGDARRPSVAASTVSRWILSNGIQSLCALLGRAPARDCQCQPAVRECCPDAARNALAQRRGIPLPCFGSKRLFKLIS